MTEDNVTKYDVETVARVIDPSAWDAYDRFIGWERRTDNVMPVDALEKITASSRSQAYKILSNLESYTPPISESIDHETSIYELRNMYVNNREQVFPGDDNIPGDRERWASMLTNEFFTAIMDNGLEIAGRALDKIASPHGTKAAVLAEIERAYLDQANA